MKTILHLLLVILISVSYSCNSKSNKELPEVEEPTGSVVPVHVPDSLKKNKKNNAKVYLTLNAIGNTEQDLKYSSDKLEVENAEIIVIQFTNESTEPDMLHNVVITENGKYKEAIIAGKKAGATSNYAPHEAYIIAASPLAKPGQSVTMEFPAPAAGRYNFVCTYPEHSHDTHGELLIK